MTDIVERLRNKCRCEPDNPTCQACEDADEIERLREWHDNWKSLAQKHDNELAEAEALLREIDDSGYIKTRRTYNETQLEDRVVAWLARRSEK